MSTMPSQRRAIRKQELAGQEEDPILSFLGLQLEVQVLVFRWPAAAADDDDEDAQLNGHQ
jgi:hypothetical protein